MLTSEAQEVSEKMRPVLESPTLCFAGQQRSMPDSEPPDQEPVVQPPNYQPTSLQLQCCLACGAVGLSDRIAVHTCRDTPAASPGIKPRTPRATDSTRRADPTDSQARALQQCADRLKSLSNIQSTAIRTDNPHVEDPMLEIVVGPDERTVSPRILQILATSHCGLRGLHTRAQPRYWTLEAVSMPKHQPTTNDQVQ